MNKKEKLENFVCKALDRIIQEVPLVQYYAVARLNKKHNLTGGRISVSYVPEMLKATFYLYTSFYQLNPDLELDKKEILSLLCHEVGHIFIWELTGTNKDVEKTATYIGRLIYDLVEKDIIRS
ncbi:hypothetical protein J7J62_08160 [bacterium]|nr:hypothetical protein [bacterium]